MVPLTTQDEEQLGLLVVFHYLAGALGLLLSLVPIGHIVMGSMMARGTFPANPGEEAPSALLGWVLIGAGAAAILAGLTLSACILLAARYLRRCERYQFCIVVAAIACIFVPMGTLLGVFTILVLQRQTVKDTFMPPADR